jgi:hypothetical protein
MFSGQAPSFSGIKSGIGRKTGRCTKTAAPAAFCSFLRHTPPSAGFFAEKFYHSMEKIAIID